MKIEYNKDLTGCNTFGMRVSCSCFAEYDTPEEYSSLYCVPPDGSPGGTSSGTAGKMPADLLPKPFLHIGGGSNLLFTGDFPGTVFHSRIRFIRELSRNGGNVLIEAGAGTLWDDVCVFCAENGLWGVENLSGIPGEAGAAAVQNIGAYGAEIKDIVEEVKCFDAVTLSMKTIKAEECGYGYRTSMFKEGAKGRYTVMSVVLRLSETPKPRLEYGHLREAVEAAGAGITPLSVRHAVLGIRNAKLPDPSKIGNAGSFFKNPVVPKFSFDIVENYAKSRYGDDYEVPHFDAGSGFVKIPAAWLIEQCGWKGKRHGNAGVYEKQPLVLINVTGTATPQEILDLERKIINSVETTFGIGLTPEVEHI